METQQSHNVANSENRSTQGRYGRFDFGFTTPEPMEIDDVESDDNLHDPEPMEIDHDLVYLSSPEPMEVDDVNYYNPNNIRFADSPEPEPMDVDLVNPYEVSPRIQQSNNNLFSNFHFNSMVNTNSTCNVSSIFTPKTSQISENVGSSLSSSATAQAFELNHQNSRSSQTLGAQFSNNNAINHSIQTSCFQPPQQSNPTRFHIEENDKNPKKISFDEEMNQLANMFSKLSICDDSKHDKEKSGTKSTERQVFGLLQPSKESLFPSSKDKQKDCTTTEFNIFKKHTESYEQIFADRQRL